MSPATAGSRLALLAELFARFAGVGIVFAVINIVVLWLLIGVAGLGYISACIISFVLLTGLSCLVSKKVAFLQEGRVRWHELGRFGLVSAASLASNLALMALLVEIVGWPPLAASLLVTVVLSVANFAGHLLFSFRVDLDREAARRAAR